MLAGKARQDLEADFVAVAALERFLEIISEASRYILDELKQKHQHIPWRQVADRSRNAGSVSGLHHVSDAYTPRSAGREKGS